jgi:hypothetical protein
MDDKAILAEAREKINAKQYREARLLLQDIAYNPTAAKWIAKLDELDLRQLEQKPLPQSASSFGISKPLPDLAAPPVRQSQQAGSKAPISVIRVAVFIVACIAALVVSSLRRGNPFQALGNLLNPSQTYSDSRISLTHSSGWSQQDMSSHGWCRDDSTNFQCLYFIKHSPNIGMLFTYASLSRVFPPAEHAESDWQYDVQDTVFVKRNRQLQDLSVAGLPAVAQMYTQSEKDENGGEFYMADIYIHNGLDSYLINVFANSACNLEREIDKVNAVLSSLRVVHENTLAEEGGYTEASPVTLSIAAC